MSLNLRQHTVYSLKRLNGVPLFEALRGITKKAAGLYFDTFLKVYKTEGMTFEIPRQHSTLTLRGKFTLDTYELPERTLLKKYLPPRSQVLELGGCIGVVSCVTNQALENKRAHAVIEANPCLIDLLIKNRDTNACQFSIFNCIVSTRHNASFAASKDMDSGRVAERGINIETVTIRQLQKMLGLRFNAMIMDIEGAEIGVIEEFADHFTSFDFIMIEFHPSITGQEGVSRSREILLKAGLKHVDTMLTTEVYLRSSTSTAVVEDNGQFS